MVRKPIYRTYTKKYLFTAFALMMLVTCWEASLTNAAIAGQSIPSESIRIRIIANSDSAGDQWIKGKVRDAVVRAVNGWINDPHNIEQARADIRAHIPQLEQVVGEELSKYGYSYPYKVELGMVPFPAKVFGNRVYPAGEYEALRITLGGGEGLNWWCVLYPPLCFVNMAVEEKSEKESKPAANSESKAEAKKAKEAKEAKASSKEKTGQGKKAAKLDQDKNGADSSASKDSGQETEKDRDSSEQEIRFFVVDLFKKAVGFIKSLMI